MEEPKTTDTQIANIDIGPFSIDVIPFITENMEVVYDYSISIVTYPEHWPTKVSTVIKSSNQYLPSKKEAMQHAIDELLHLLSNITNGLNDVKLHISNIKE